MFLSKIWFVLVALIGGVAVTAAFVAPRTADRRIEQLEGQRLDRAQYAAEQMLKTDAHRWIDFVAKLGRDAILAEGLDGATRGVGEPRVVHDTVRNRLRALVPDLAGIGIDTLVATDGKGRVVARLGESESEYGDSLAGAEIVADGLRGYMSDDVMGTNGKLGRLAAAPVIAKTRDHIVGVMYLGAETSRRLVDLWKKNLGVEAAILMKGQVVASSLPESQLGTLPGLIDQHRQEMTEAKRTRAMPFNIGAERILAVAAPFAGQAGEQDAYFVLMGKQAPASNPLGLLATTTDQDLKWGNFPWLGLLAGLAMVLALGLWLQRSEMDLPLSRLRSEVQRLARGELPKLRDTEFHGKFGGIARDVNAVIERFTHAPVIRSSDAGRRDLHAVFGANAGAPDSGRAFDLVTTGGPFAGPKLGGTGGPSLVAASTLGATPQQRLVSPALTPAPTTSLRGAVPISQSAAPFALPPAPPPALAPPAFAPPVFAPPAVPAARPPLPPTRPPTPVAPSPLSGNPIAAAQPPRAQAPTPIGGLELDMQLLATPAGGARPALPPPTAPPAASAVLQELDESDTSSNTIDEPTRTLDPDDAHFRDVFAEYLSTRQQCGEPLGSLTFEKFRAKLETNRQALVAKHNCRSARFTVYVKDGKAALKAAPLR